MIEYITALVFLVPMVYQDIKLRAVHESFLIALYICSVGVSALLYPNYPILIVGGIGLFAAYKKLDPKEETLGSADMILIMGLLNLFSLKVIEILAVSLVFAYFYTEITKRDDIPFFGCVLIGLILHLLFVQFVLPNMSFPITTLKIYEGDNIYIN